MEITCPNCRKAYSVNPARLPPEAKTAKCKACNHLIPLDSASVALPAGQPAVIELACSCCGRSYRLCQDKVPSGTKSFKCKSCGHPVPVRRQSGSAPVHALKKEPSMPASNTPANKPDVAGGGPQDIFVFACTDCGKIYKIPRNRIPPQTTAAKCKSCGHLISLQLPGSKPAAADYLKSHPQQIAPAAAESKPMPAGTPPVIRRGRKRRWLAALAAGLALAAVWGGLTHREIFDVNRLKQLLPGKSERTAESSRPLENEPFLAANMELSPSPGAVVPRYMRNPDLVAAVDVDRLKSGIAHIIGDGLFPGEYQISGETPTMTLDLDPVDIPNAALAELTYTVKAIRTVDGKDVLSTDKSQFTARLQPGSLFPGILTLKIKKDTAPDTLGRAVIDFQLVIPAALEIFDFKSGKNKGSVKEADGIRITLDGLEKDVARVSSSENSIRLFAYDQSGNALALKESKHAASSVAARFYGIIDLLRVVVIRDMLAYPFEVAVDLNGGKALALAREAEIPARIRYNPHPVPSYADFTAEDLEKLSVTWNEGRPDAWNDSLSIKLPDGPFSGDAVWEVHFFGADKPQMLTGNSVRGNKEVSYILDKDSLQQVSAAFGKVQLNLHSGIKRLIFFRKEGLPLQPDIRNLPSGDEVAVAFDKNEISYSTGNAEVIQIAGYDARGNRLKQDPYTRSKAHRRLIYFWGVPAKCVIDVSTKTIEKQVPFEIRQRPLDENSYLAYRQRIENQRDVVQIIKALDRARRSDRSYYGDDLAGLYYLYDHKKQAPMRLISQEVAHSDPAGQERFGYQVKPYKGYFFTVLSGIETNGVNKDYDRRLKKSNFIWQNGTITTTALTRHPDLAAIPEDNSQPTFFLQWGQVFMKPLNGKKLAYLPDGYYNNGWVEAKFIAN